MFKTIIELLKLIPFFFGLYRDIAKKIEEKRRKEKQEEQEKLAKNLDRAKRAKTDEERKKAFDDFFDDVN